MPDTAWPVSGYPPGSSRSRRNTPVSMSPKSFGTSATIRSRSPSRSPPDASTDAFSSSLTTTVFSQRSMRRLEASLRRATPKGHETFISRTAPHQGPAPTSSPPHVQDTLRHAQSGALPSWPCLGPGRVIVSWMPCDCPSATQCASGAGHLRVSCQTPGAVLVKHGNVADAQTDGQVMQYRELPLRPDLLTRFQPAPPL